MAQTTTGLRALLSVPVVYETFQRLVGARRVRATLVDRYVGVRPGLRVLDIGCGPGTLLEHLPDVSYTGTDVSTSYIAAARRRYGGLATFHVGRVEDLTCTNWASSTSSSPRASTTSTRTRPSTGSTSRRRCSRRTAGW